MKEAQAEAHNLVLNVENFSLDLVLDDFISVNLASSSTFNGDTWSYYFYFVFGAYNVVDL